MFIEKTEDVQSFSKIIKEIKSNLASGKNQFDGVSAEKIEKLKNRYSDFNDSFVNNFLISSTMQINKLHPPKGWFHYMMNLKNEIDNIAISVASQDGAGVLSLDSVLFGPISKLSGNENYMHVSQVYRNTRNVWIKNSEGTVFSLSPQPSFYNNDGKLDAENYDSYKCEQGTGFSTISSSRDNIDFLFRLFVPLDLPGEIWTISVKNNSDKPQSLDIYPEVNFGLDSHPSHYFVGMAVSEVDYLDKHNAILAKNLDIKNSFPRWGVFISGEKSESFESSADKYYGFGSAVMYPPAIFSDRLSCTEAKQPLKGMMGVFQYKIDLKPGEEKQINLALASINPEEDIETQLKKWHPLLSKENTETALKTVKKAWDKVFRSYLIDSPSREINRNFNVWGKYQSIICSRFNSPYDVGTRDMFQYLLANCVFEPSYVKLLLPYLLKYQYRDGRIPRQICKFSDMHDLRNFMDCQLWAPDLALLYLKETGDFDILDQQVGFLEDDNVTLSDRDSKSLYEHLILAVKSVYENNIGSHGLCKLGYGGWNDALDGLRGDNSESVWLSQLLIYAAKKMIELAEFKDDQANLDYLNALVEKVTTAINENGWDKNNYYIFGYDNDGNPVGSSSNAEGQKHLNENSWAILSGIAPKDRIKPVIDAMEELNTPFGPRLLVPYSKKSANEVGRIADQAKGHFENGSVYQHGVLFWAKALLEAGFVDQAYSAFSLISNENRIPDISTNPATYHSNYTAVPDNNDYGKEPYYPFSGSHTWRMKFLVDMLGIEPQLDHLLIDPKIPTQWKDKFRDGETIIKIRKRSNRIEHKNVILNVEIERNNTLTLMDGKKVFVNNNLLNKTDDKFIIQFDNPMFVNDTGKDLEIKILMYI